MDGISYPWPSIVPLTDEELGMVPTADGRLMPWDGVPGPKRRKQGDRDVVVYQDMEHVDYIDIQGTMTAFLTARTSPAEYKARTLAMAAVYWSLGIQNGEELRPDNYKRLMRQKADWALYSFRAVAADESDLRNIESQAKHKFSGTQIFRFEMYRWGEHREDPASPKIVTVEILEEVTAYSDGKSVIRRIGNTWEADVSIPT